MNGVMKHWGETLEIIKFNYQRVKKLEEEYPHSSSLRKVLKNNEVIFENFKDTLTAYYLYNTLGITLADVSKFLKKEKATAKCWDVFNSEGRNFIPSESMLQKIRCEEDSAIQQDFIESGQITFNELLGVRNKKGSVKDLLT